MKIILKIHDNIQLVDSSLKDQQVMEVRFSKSVQKKRDTKQNKRKEERKKTTTTKNKETRKQTNKQRKGTISEENNFIG